MSRFALKRIKRTQVRKGMVLVARTETPPKGMSSSYPCLLSTQLELDKTWADD
jgi:hypothetical protein